MRNGDFYVYGIGSFDGVNYVNAKTLQQIINRLISDNKRLDKTCKGLIKKIKEMEDNNS